MNEVPMRPVDALFPGRREAITAQRCIPAPIGCGGPASAFRDDLSAREYRISGFCQACQDSVFGEGDEDERCERGAVGCPGGGPIPHDSECLKEGE